MRKYIRLAVLAMLSAAMLCSIGGCAGPSGSPEGSYINISAAEAKEIMDSQSGYIILDVRTEEEFAEGHIPGAVLIPDYEISDRAEKELPDKDQLILVYCRSGRRSKLAAERLAQLGYTDIREFGGIIDWPYEVTAE